jgi:hypothetical protein
MGSLDAQRFRFAAAECSPALAALACADDGAGIGPAAMRAALLAAGALPTEATLPWVTNHYRCGRRSGVRRAQALMTRQVGCVEAGKLPAAARARAAAVDCRSRAGPAALPVRAAPGPPRVRLLTAAGTSARSTWRSGRR